VSTEARQLSPRIPQKLEEKTVNAPGCCASTVLVVASPTGGKGGMHIPFVSYNTGTVSTEG